MTNFAIVILVAAFICATNVYVYADDANDNNNNNNGDMPGFLMNMPEMNMPKMTMPPFMNPWNIMNMKPADNNTKVFGEVHSSSSHTEMKDGKVVDQGASAKSIVNDNGNVTEHNASS